jgi:hypothetical protein
LGVFKVKKLLMMILLVQGSLVPVNIQAIDIFYAIKSYHLKDVRTWLKLERDLTICNKEGQSILHAAVLTGKSKMVKTILKSGIDVNILDKGYQTALDYAVESGTNEIILNVIKYKGKVTSMQNAEFVSLLAQKVKRNFWFMVALKFGLLMPLFLMVGFVLGATIAVNIFGLVINYAETSFLAYIIVGATIGAFECLLMPPYLAFPGGFLWGLCFIETGGMIVMALPIAPFYFGFSAIVVGATYLFITPKKEKYLLAV